MRAKFMRGDEGRLGIRFEPETFEEQLLLESFARGAVDPPREFRFSGWERDHPERLIREGLTSCWGQLVKAADPRRGGVDAARESLERDRGRAISASPGDWTQRISEEDRGRLGLPAPDRGRAWYRMGDALCQGFSDPAPEFFPSEQIWQDGLFEVAMARIRLLEDLATHGAAVARDASLGRTSEEIRDEIIREVGMMASARTPEMQARYDAAVERERRESSPTRRSADEEEGPVSQSADRATRKKRGTGTDRDQTEAANVAAKAFGRSAASTTQVAADLQEGRPSQKVLQKVVQKVRAEPRSELEISDVLHWRPHDVSGGIKLYAVKDQDADHRVDLGGGACLLVKDHDGAWLDFAVLEPHGESTEDGATRDGAARVDHSMLLRGSGPSELRECSHVWWGEDGYTFYLNFRVVEAALRELRTWFDVAWQDGPT